jgi:hypothetical protein
MNTEKLISLKENFTGQKFQWIKTNRPELLGKVVRCRDVDPGPGGTFLIMFDDGSKIDSTKLNSDLMMIHGDMQPLSRGEVEMIYGSKKEPKLGLKPNVQPTQTSAPVIEQTITPPQPEAIRSEPVRPAAPSSNMFEMFNSDETQISIGLKVKLPDRKLLKMMYSSAENKEKFLNELAEYLYSKINKQVIKESMQQVLDPGVIKKEPKPIINFKEVDESR